MDGESVSNSCLADSEHVYQYCFTAEETKNMEHKFLMKNQTLRIIWFTSSLE